MPNRPSTKVAAWRLRYKAVYPECESFDGEKSVQSARRVAQRDVVHQASDATTPMGRFCPFENSPLQSTANRLNPAASSYGTLPD
tara:strand:- start:3449 stop:3703 length:255 start_codon:yes stop_codon:yes gene_type:complete